MSARDNILKAVAANKPPSIAPPDIDVKRTDPLPIGDAFEVAVKNLSAVCTKVASLQEALQMIQAKDGALTNRINMIDADQQLRDSIAKADADALQLVSKAYIRGTLGVAENGAIWISEPDMGNRLLPFITEHLVIVINTANLVYDMHEAYQKIRVNEYGYGVFIAGPSKTADIEQSLVIGAHGPRSLEVYLVGE
ncbi:MAG TPA: LUD domain-containing protein [Flavitalea sp.]|nr:LUD domain-containing protein [Flavitalea sp.]